MYTSDPNAAPQQQGFVNQQQQYPPPQQQGFVNQQQQYPPQQQGFVNTQPGFVNSQPGYVVQQPYVQPQGQPYIAPQQGQYPPPQQQQQAYPSQAEVVEKKKKKRKETGSSESSSSSSSDDDKKKKKKKKDKQPNITISVGNVDTKNTNNAQATTQNMNNNYGGGVAYMQPTVIYVDESEIPYVPFPFALLIFFLNFWPGLGTIILACFFSNHPNYWTCEAIKQFLLAFIIIGIIFSIVTGCRVLARSMQGPKTAVIAHTTVTHQTHLLA